nr:thioesterase family protein [Alicyclobacillus sacchari]
MPLKHETRIRVRFSDTDLNGHVNNAVYATYMEESRIAFVRDIFPDEKLSLVLASLHIDYRAQTYYPEHQWVVATTWLTRIGRSSFEFYCEICSEEGVLLCEGTAVVVNFDFAKQTSQPLSDEVKARLSQYLVAKEDRDPTHV